MLLMQENTEYACFERDALEKEYCNLVFMKGIIECWLELLPDDERFLVQKHLIQGLDWAKVIVEYNERWGIMNGRAERTLKRIHARAIKRMPNLALTHLISFKILIVQRLSQFIIL